MKRLSMVLCLMAAPFAAVAEEWRVLTGPEIADVLTGKVLRYDNGWQDFRASGRTLYHVGRDSWGYWGVRGDQYCSMWPPSDLWACYGMAQAGDRLQFLGEAGDVTEGVLDGEVD